MRPVSGPILALDLATACGWAIGAPSETPRFGTHVLPSCGDDVGKFAWAFHDWLTPLVSTERPHLIIYEAPVLPRQTTPATVIKLNGLAYDTEKIARYHRVRVVKANVSRLKKFWTGSGRATKDDMMAAARRQGLRVRTEHDADACAAWALACAYYAAEPADRARWQFGQMGGDSHAF